MAEKIYVPRTKAKIKVTWNVGSHDNLVIDQVKQIVQKALNDALLDTLSEVEIWIEDHAPRRSGDLVESLEKFLQKSIPPPIAQNELRDLRLVLGVGAEIDYIKYVDKMTDAMVQHPGTWREHSGKLAYSKGHPIFLYDPNAYGKFFDKMVVYAKERFRANLLKAKYKLESSNPVTPGEISG